MLSIIIPNHNEPKLKLVQEAIPYLPFDCEVVIATDHEGEGKGATLREGLKESHGDIIAFIDGDMDIHPRMINRLIAYLEDYDIVVGTKQTKNSPLQRKIITALSRLYIRLLFGLKVDSQTGIKLFKREALFDWKTNGFACDIEILAKAKKASKTMIEVPIEATITRHMSLKAIWNTLLESLRIWINLYSL